MEKTFNNSLRMSLEGKKGRSGRTTGSGTSGSHSPEANKKRSEALKGNKNRKKGE